MNGIELAKLVRETARESAERDAGILREVGEVKTAVAVQGQRLDVAEERLNKHSERWASDTGRFHRVQLERAQTKAAELSESKRHWVRWVIGTVVTIAIGAVGAGIGLLIGG